MNKNDKYIKVSGSDVVDVFYPYQKSKFDGSEIFLENDPSRKHKINGKSISDDHGSFIFTYDRSIISEKMVADILIVSLPIHKKLKRDELKALINENWPLGIDKTREEILEQYNSFKTTIRNAKTKKDIDVLFKQTVKQLGL